MRAGDLTATKRILMMGRAVMNYRGSGVRSVKGAERIVGEGVSGRCTDEGLASVGVGRGAEEVCAGGCLDKGDLDAVCGCWVGEHYASLGERQRPLAKER